MSAHRDIEAATPAPAAAPGRIVKIASGKGGVGKTVLAATLAHSFAFHGARTLLVDCDLGLANVDVQLGIAPEHDLTDVIAGGAPLDSAVTRVAASAGPHDAPRGGFDVIAGSSGTGALSALTRTELARLRQAIALIAGHYDRVVVDLAAGIDPAVTMFTALPGPALVVVTDEPTSITDAYAFIKLAALATPGPDAESARTPDIRILVNMAETPEAGRRTYEALSRACANFLGVTPPLAGVVPRDAAIRDAIRHQMPLFARSPKAPAGAAIARIAAHLQG